MKNNLLLVFVMTLAHYASAQNFGEISGKVRDEAGLELPGVLVVVDGGAQKVGTATEYDGNFRIGGLSAGVYSLEFTMTGKQKRVLTRVQVRPDQITRVGEILMSDSAYTTGTVIIETFNIPLIDINGGTMTTLTSKELKNLPAANGGGIKQIVSVMSSDVKSSPSGEELYFRGSRSGSVIYFLDGIKIRQNVPNIPSSAISSIAVYSGGVPAKYGDSTGGFIVVETKSYLEEYYSKLNGYGR